jgi:hypothetical protein
MSDIKKWIKLVESSENRIADVPKTTGQFAKNATVTVSPKVGGGVGRFVAYDGNGGDANIDIKGIIRKLSAEDFSTPARDYEDPYVKGNDWFHVSQEPNTVGTLKDKPEFRPGDMVKIADVYGAVIGPGYGIFVAYGTTGQDCIISFDNKEIVVPTANIASVLEQNAKDNFDEMDNDGNLSPMSFGSQNVKIEDPGMDQGNDFNKWMSAVEEALKSEGKEELEENIWSEEAANECGCAKWDCPTCFPDQDVHPGEHQPPQPGMGMDSETPDVIVIAAEPEGGDVCPQCGMPHDQTEHGPGINLGLEELSKDTYASYIPKAARSAADSASRGAFTLGSTPTDDPNWSDAGEADDRKAYRRLQNIDKATQRLTRETQFADTGSPKWTNDEDGEESPLTYGECNLEEDGATDEMIDEIIYMQDLGFGQVDATLTYDVLKRLPPEKLQAVHQKVMGGGSPPAMDEEMQDEEMLVPPPELNPQGGAALGGGGAGGGEPGDFGGIKSTSTKYAPGTAPTMPESIQKGKPTMENVDKDVAAMLQSLKKYDRLVESKGPVLGLKTLTMEGKPEWLTKAEKKAEGEEEDPKKKKKEVEEAKSAGYDLKKNVKEEELDEQADPEVLSWMKRFSNLGRLV